MYKEAAAAAITITIRVTITIRMTLTIPEVFSSVAGALEYVHTSTSTLF
jgi:hypothetical protein